MVCGYKGNKSHNLQVGKPSRHRSIPDVDISPLAKNSLSVTRTRRQRARPEIDGRSRDSRWQNGRKAAAISTKVQ